MREIITMACEACANRNYTAERNKKTQKEKLELKKYCAHCRKHTLHKEGKS
jgi:large subunit ribosomal protein L33